MWRRYFKLVKLVPGKVIVQWHGTIDFAGDVPVDLCQKLYEEDFEFLEITEEGKRDLYGIESQKSGVGSLETKTSFDYAQDDIHENKPPVEKPKRSYKKRV